MLYALSGANPSPLGGIVPKTVICIPGDNNNVNSFHTLNFAFILPANVRDAVAPEADVQVAVPSNSLPGTPACPQLPR